jgi:hypothetical protein
MNFKHYLTEMPHINDLVQLECPCPEHKGDKHIDGGDADLVGYDALAEMMDKNNPKEVLCRQRLMRAFPMTAKGTGTAPFLCRNDFSIFMYDAQKQIGFAPKTDEDIQLCSTFMNNLLKEDNREKNNFMKNPIIWEKLHILTK